MNNRINYSGFVDLVLETSDERQQQDQNRDAIQLENIIYPFMPSQVTRPAPQE